MADRTAVAVATPLRLRQSAARAPARRREPMWPNIISPTPTTAWRSTSTTKRGLRSKRPRTYAARHAPCRDTIATVTPSPVTLQMNNSPMNQSAGREHRHRTFEVERPIEGWRACGGSACPGVALACGARSGKFDSCRAHQHAVSGASDTSPGPTRARRRSSDALMGHSPPELRRDWSGRAARPGRLASGWDCRPSPQPSVPAR